VLRFQSVNSISVNAQSECFQEKSSLEKSPAGAQADAAVGTIQLLKAEGIRPNHRARIVSQRSVVQQAVRKVGVYLQLLPVEKII